MAYESGRRIGGGGFGGGSFYGDDEEQDDQELEAQSQGGMSEYQNSGYDGYNPGSNFEAEMQDLAGLMQGYPDVGAGSGWEAPSNYDPSKVPAPETAPLDEGGMTGGESPYGEFNAGEGAGDGGGSGSFEDDLRAALAELLGQGPRDTSADEALIEDYYGGKLGSGMADIMARMGASGFGQSGAQAQMGADLQGQLAREAQADVMGLRQTARDSWRNDLNQLANFYMGDRVVTNQENYQDNVAQILAELMGGGSEDQPQNQDLAGAIQDQFGYSNPEGLKPEEQGSPQNPYEVNSANIDSLPLTDQQKQYLKSSPESMWGVMVQGTDGRYYRISALGGLSPGSGENRPDNG